MAEELQVSILVIAHLNKDAKKEAIDRIGGSVGISNRRSVLFAGPDPDDPDGKVKMLAHPKCNVGPEQPTLKYRTETCCSTMVVLNPSRPPGSCGKVKPLGITAQDLVARPEPMSREDRGRVVEWLEKALPAGGAGNKPISNLRPRMLGSPAGCSGPRSRYCRSRPKRKASIPPYGGGGGRLP